MAREVAVTWLESLKTEIRIGRHRLVADEPVDKGGDDAARPPSISCWRPSAPERSSRFGCMPSASSGRSTTSKPGSTGSRPRERSRPSILELILGGDLDEEQKQRLLQIAERCPVHRTLTESVQITHA